jgi:hypothetical protein
MRNRDSRKLLLMVIAFAMTSFWGLTCVAQDEKPWQLPMSLRPSLDERVNVFMAAQAEGRWDQVALLLGDYYRAGNYLRYTPARKACLMMQLQAAPMTAFTFNVQESPFSSEILSTPPGRRWWTLIGEGTFRVGIDKVTRRASITAYRDGNNWYFTPGTYFDYEVWARTHLPAKKVAADPKYELDLLVPPDCPLEVVDFRVMIDEKDRLSRRIQFRLHNRSTQRVDGYFFEISDEREDGSISVSTPEFIEPGAFSRTWDENKSVHSFWCEAEPRIRLKIEDVTLSNGTIWKSERSSTAEKLPK